MTVYMVINTGRVQAMQVARTAADVLLAAGAQVVMDEYEAGCEGRGFAPVTKENEEKYCRCDIVLCVGGDGTILHAARHAMQFHKPLLGINIGRLGFLTVLENDELDKLTRLVSGEYTVDYRRMLRADVRNREDVPCVALNDVVLFKDSPEKTITLDIYCDDILVSHFRGDGVIFATATGSTAYSMSAGGPILDARLNGTVVTQICAHMGHTPPLVVAADRVLRAVATGAQDETIRITCDSMQNSVLKRGQSVTITQSEWTVPLVQFNDAQQLEAIDKKLKGR